MNWKAKLKEYKADFEKLIGDKPEQQQPQYHQHQQYPPPGHAPHQGYAPPQGYGGAHSYPPPPLPPPLPEQRGGHVYWQPKFQPDIPVTADWDAKLGNGPDGWGNQELQHYTAEQQNAF